MTEIAWAKAINPEALSLLSDAWARLTDTPWQPELIKTALEEGATKHHLKLGKAQAPVRVAITGRTVSLPLFEYGSLQPRPVAVGSRFGNLGAVEGLIAIGRREHSEVRR